MLNSVEFETHITVALSAPDGWARFASWCDSRALKCVHIALQRGQTPSQPMLTFHGRGTLDSQLQRATQLRHDCEAAGFAVTRIKLEIAPNDAAALVKADQTSERYFEHHIKLLLPADADMTALNEAITSYGARLSRNARRERADGGHERFVTQRCHDADDAQAQSCFVALVEVLRGFPFPILETEREYVVFDSNLALDAGWFADASQG